MLQCLDQQTDTDNPLKPLKRLYPRLELDASLLSEPMPWGITLILVSAGIGLCLLGGVNRDDVVGLLMRIIGMVFLVAASIFGRLLWLDLAGIALALWLPSASKRQQV